MLFITIDSDLEMFTQRSSEGKSRLDSQWNSVLSWVLIITGILGLVISVAGVFIDLGRIWPVLHNTQAMLLAIVSLLSVGLGIERFLIIHEIGDGIKSIGSSLVTTIDLLTRNFDNLIRTLHNALPIQIFTNEKAVFEDVYYIIEGCEDFDVIRATSLLPPKQEGDYAIPYDEAYFPRVAKRIRRAKENGGSLSYRITMSNDRNTVEQMNGIKIRLDAFEAEKVVDRLSIRFISMTWPLAFLIVGDSLVIGFISSTGDNTFRLAIRITNKTVAAHISQWYDDFLWNHETARTWYRRENMFEES